MEDQENEEQEQGLGEQAVETGKQVVEQAAKEGAKQIAKQAGKVAAEGVKSLAAKFIIPALPYILGAVLILLLILGIYAIKDKIAETLNNIATSIVDFVGMGDNGPVIPSANEMTDLIDKALKEQGIDITTLDMGNEKQTKLYLYKFMAASLSTQLPYIKESTGEKLIDIAKKGWLLYELDKKNEVNGIVHIKRDSGNGAKDLTFKKYEDFAKMIEENNTDAVNYFSIDKDWMLCIAKHNSTTTTDSSNNTTTEHRLEEVKIPYQTMVSKYSVPFEYFIALQQITLNPEYVSAVADLIQNQGEIDLTIFDSTEEITTEYTYKYKTMKRWSTEEPKKDSSGNTIEEETETVWHDTKEENLTEQSEKTVTVEKINSVTANITMAKVWVIDVTATYDKSNTTEYPYGENGTTTKLDNETPPPEKTQGEWKVARSQTIKEIINKQEWKLASSDVKIESDTFLGLWRNKSGNYEENAPYEKKPKGIKVKYKKPDGLFIKEAPIENILSSEDWLYELLEKSENTQTHAQLMRYLIALYKANGDESKVDVEIDLDIFDPNEFTEISYGSNTLKDFIHSFEGTPPESGGKYVVFDDGFGNLTVGWGIYINSHTGRFAARGINASTLRIGTTVEKSIVDSIEDEIITEYRKYVIEVTSGLDLEEYQIDALTSRAYNCGKNGGMSGFVKAYEQYGNTNALYENLLNKPITSKGEIAPGLVKRRQYEWELFHRGYYYNTNTYYSASGKYSKNIVENAKKCHDYLRTNGYKYQQAGISIPITNSVKTVDCSSFVSWVLYESGFKQFAGWQKTASYFERNPMNWEKVTKDKLQPGDILVYTGHVQIYAGDGKYYNCGGDTSISHEAPSTYGTSINDSSFKFGLRPSV